MSAHILAVVIYTGAACVSPLEAAPNATVVGKTPCAEIIRYSSANPYKIVQEPNVVSEAKPRVAAKHAPAKKGKKKRRRG